MKQKLPTIAEITTAVEAKGHKLTRDRSTLCGQPVFILTRKDDTFTSYTQSQLIETYLNGTLV